MTTPLDFEHFIVGDNKDGVVLVTLNRPEKLNAMNRQWFTELRQLMGALDADPESRVAIITGAGRAFSAGGDIESFDELTDIRRARDHLRLVFDSFDSIAR